MTARSTCSCQWGVLAVLCLASIVACSCVWDEGAQVTPTMPPWTLQSTPIVMPSRTLTIPERTPTTVTPLPLPEVTPSPRCTATPLPTVRTTPLALSWTGPLIVPAQLSPSSGEVFIPVYDLGRRQSVQIPLVGFEKVHIDGWSADGCFLIVTGRPRGEKEAAIYLVNIESGISRFLLDKASDVMFSPDGKWIAYVTPKIRTDIKQRIYVVRADGSEPAKLVAQDEFVGLEGWTTDGRKLLYWTWEGGSYAMDADSMERCLIYKSPEILKRWEDIYLADPVTCERIPLALSVNLETVVWKIPSMAPGGRYMALFLGEEEMGGDFGIGPSWFLMVDLETGREHVVAEEPFGMSNLWAWAPDGTYLALVADFPEGKGVYLVEAATGQRRKLNVGPSLSPSWSPDGRWLALQSLERNPPSASAPPLIYNLETETVIYLPVEFGYSRTPQPQPLLWSPRLSYEGGSCRE